MKNLEIIKLLRKKLNKILLRVASYKFNTNIIKSNKTIIFIFSLTFLYLCYLSIPALYNEIIIKEKLKKELIKVFNSEHIEFEKYNYTFFPKPNFNIANVVIFEKEDKKIILAKIKQVNFDISQKNLFIKNDFYLNSIKILEANFNISKNNIHNYEKLFSKVIEQRIKVTKSKIFFNDKNNATFAMISVSNLKLFFDNKKKHNKITLNGHIYNLPFKLIYNVNFYKNENALKVNFGKIKLLFENYSKINEYYSSTNQIKFLNTKFINKINNKENKNIFKIKSENSKINQSNINYKGTVNVKPFFFDFNIKVSEINLFKLVFFNSFFESLASNLLLENKYLNGKIVLHLEKIKNDKLINKGRINLKIQRGEFDLSESEFFIKNIAKAKVVSNKFFIKEGQINLQVYLNLFINNQDKLYKKFLISKKNRIDLKKVFFSIEINPSKKELIIGDFEINDKDNESYNEITFAISSLQDLRKSINQLLINYEG